MTVGALIILVLLVLWLKAEWDHAKTLMELDQTMHLLRLSEDVAAWESAVNELRLESTGPFGL